MNLIRPNCYYLLLVLLVVNRTASGAPVTSETSAEAGRPRVVIGRIEFMVVRDVGLRLKARIDTGAGVSSIHAKNLEIKKTPEGERVRFQITDAEGTTKTLERPIIGWSQIKVMGTNQKNRRPIVELRICLGGKKLRGRVNLNERSNFLCPVLIGRNLLNTGKYLVDPSQKYLSEPDCD